VNGVNGAIAYHIRREIHEIGLVRRLYGKPEVTTELLSNKVLEWSNAISGCGCIQHSVDKNKSGLGLEWPSHKIL
jgi:hypothetical protein